MNVTRVVDDEILSFNNDSYSSHDVEVEEEAVCGLWSPDTEIDEIQNFNENFELLNVDNKNMLTFMSLNVNSARRKKEKLEVLVGEYGVDVLMLNETDQKDNDTFFRNDWIKGFNLLGFENKPSGKCGGVAVLFGAELENNFKPFDFSSSCPAAHQLVVSIISDFLVVSIYRSPNANDQSQIKCLKSDITKITNKAKTLKLNVLVVGDLNPGNYNFHDETGGTKQQIELADHLKKKGLFQLVEDYTYPASKNTLDLILTNAPKRVSAIQTVDTDISNHRFIIFNLSIEVIHKEESIVDDWKNADWHKFVEVVKDLSWPMVDGVYPRNTTYEDLNLFYERFVNNFLIAKKLSVPKKTVIPRRAKSDLIDNEISKLFRLRKNYKKSKKYELLQNADMRLRELRDQKIKIQRKSFLHGLHTEKSNIYKHMSVMKPGPANAPYTSCLLYTSPSPRDLSTSRMPSSA